MLSLYSSLMALGTVFPTLYGGCFMAIPGVDLYKLDCFNALIALLSLPPLRQLSGMPCIHKWIFLEECLLELNF